MFHFTCNVNKLKACLKVVQVLEKTVLANSINSESSAYNETGHWKALVRIFKHFAQTRMGDRKLASQSS